MTVFLQGLSAGKIWAEMSTTDAAEVARLGALVEAKGASPVDCPVSGGCHRAATGNIAIFARCDRPVFERLLPVLTILGSRDINFTMDLVLKDIGLFQSIAEQHNVPLEVSPLLTKIFEDRQARFGPREWSPNIIKRLEEACNTEILAAGFPAEMTDDEPEEPGYEVIPKS